MKQILYKRELFAAVNEQDNGQITTNPYILAKRHMVSNHTVDLALLNGIPAFHGITNTQEELDLIMANLYKCHTLFLLLITR